MSGVAVAVHDRRDAVLLAAADAGGLRLVAAAQAGTPPATAVADFFGDDPPGVVVRVGTTAGGAFPGGPRVLVVPAAVAVLAAEPELPDGPVLVVDDDGATLVRDGVPEPVGEPGTDLSDLSDPAGLAALVRATGAELVVVAGTVGPLLVADAPDRRAGSGACPVLPCPVRVAGLRPAGGEPWGPEAAAVVGAAVLGAGVSTDTWPGSGPGTEAGLGPGAQLGPAPGVDPGPGQGAGRAAPWPGDPGAGAGPAEPGPAGAPVPATPPADGPDRARAAIVVAGVLGAVLLGAGLLLAGPRPAPPAGATVVQYGYAATLPTGWEHTGGDPQRRRVLLTPVGGPDGADLLVLERSPLGYDAGREPDRARRELAALVGGKGPATALVGGRPVLRWSEDPGDGTVVDWHVVFDGSDQLVAGCRRPAAAPVAPACVEVVASLHRVR
ncbi:type VII secretion-associated protein [Pseudonocardia sp. HH130629-09]|uniref:type VII secretion-associated protein n=1 Tax=Pseudonocardia sp. HH130629-09 TaxID=1641402 RepID=UPI0006CAF77B|nr:type VII secretion-associated protein [Pseudonocardia sp. HH130629-09]ALE81945.1 hypothetical protein XF36_01380 [Pseudonocardia sp. HH130629-09]